MPFTTHLNYLTGWRFSYHCTLTSDEHLYEITAINLKALNSRTGQLKNLILLNSNPRYFFVLETLTMEVSDEVSSCLANAFAKLDTLAKQRKALSGLFERLSRYQIRDSLVLLKSTDFSYDVVGNLPVEVNITIFQYLELYEVFQARRVSRMWMQMLSSPALLEALLQQWDSMGETPLRIPEGIAPQPMRSIRAEHIDAYRNGLAFSKMAYKWDVPPTVAPGAITYTNGILAWIGRMGREVFVLYLETGAKYTYMPSNREMLVKITISTSLVAVTASSGTCYVWEIPSGRANSFRLTNILMHNLVSSGKTLAVLEGSSHSLRDHVTTWNLDTQKSYYFPVMATPNLDEKDSQGPPHFDKKIIVSNSGLSVVVFQRIISDPEVISFLHLSLDGHVQSSGSLNTPQTGFYGCCPEEEWQLPLAKHPTIWSYIYREPYSQPTKDGLARLPTDYLLRVVYDSERECLRLEQYCPPFLHNASPDGPTPAKNLFFWKDLVYYRADWSPGSLTIIDLKNNKCGGADMGRWITNEFERFNHSTGQIDGEFGYPLSHPLLFGDETYIVNVFSGGFVAWCFDKHITMAGEDKGYREFRRDILRRK